MKIYVIGSLRNLRVPEIASYLRDTLDAEVFDDWYAAGPEADDYWQKYETEIRKHDYVEALRGNAAQHVYQYDKYHLDTADIGVLVTPAGKSGNLELGYLLGQGKPGFILLDHKVDRFDVMYNFATKVTTEWDTLQEYLASITGLK